MRPRQAATAIIAIAAMAHSGAHAELSAEQRAAVTQVIQSIVAAGGFAASPSAAAKGDEAALQSFVASMATSHPSTAAEITTFVTKTLMASMPKDGSAASTAGAETMVSEVVKAVVKAVPSAASSVAAAVAAAISSGGVSNSVAQTLIVSAYSTVVAAAPTQTASVMAGAPSTVSTAVTQAVQSTLANSAADPVAAAPGASSQNAAQTAAPTATAAATAEIPRTDTASPSS